MSSGEAGATADATSPARIEEALGPHTSIAEPEREPEALLSAGERAGDFVVEAVIGRGSFGSVYRAAHAVIGRRAAVKVLRRTTADARAIQSFIEEARLASKLRHPNIVDVLTFGQLEDGRHFQVMDLIEGPTLADYMKERGALSLGEALPIARGVASALDAVHASGIAHRDLKPANVVIEHRNGEPIPKLIDFGVADLVDAETPRAQRSLVGTPRYMAPEQCRGGNIDARADSYAFGLLLYEMLTGKPTFPGDDALELMLKHTNEEPTPPSQVRPSLAPAIDAVVLSLLRKKPEDRPLELSPVVRELEAIADGSAGAAAPKPAQWRIPAVAAALVIAGAGVFVLTGGLAPAANVAPSATGPASAKPAPVPLPSTIAAAVTSAPFASAAPSASSAPSTGPQGKPSLRQPSARIPGPEDPENPFKR